MGKGQRLACEYSPIIQFSSYLKGVYPSFSKRAVIDLEVNRERQHR